VINVDPHCAVVDTNVLAVAEGLHPDASEECVSACRQLLRQIQAGRVVLAVDSAQSNEEILREYLGVLRGGSKAGVASKIAVRLWRLRHDSNVCRQVDLTPPTTTAETFAEVPASLHDFDDDYHKWIAVAVAEGGKPPIYQAMDGEWWERRRDFAECGIDVQFLCAGDLIEALGH
jgi:hypothetical protein